MCAEAAWSARCASVPLLVDAVDGRRCRRRGRSGNAGSPPPSALGHHVDHGGADGLVLALRNRNSPVTTIIAPPSCMAAQPRRGALIFQAAAAYLGSNHPGTGRRTTMTVKVGINGFGRIGRNVLRAIVESGRDRYRGRGDQRSRPGRDQRPPAALRLGARPLSGRGEGRRRHHRRRPRPDQGDRRARPGQAALEGRRRRAGVHRHLHRRRRRPRCTCRTAPSGCWSPPRRAGADKTIVYGVNHDTPDRRRHGGLERVLHDELPGARSPRC